MQSDDLVIQRIEKVITSSKYRNAILHCKTVDELIEEIKKIDPYLVPFLTPSPTRPITLLDEVLTSLEQKRVVVREMGVGLNWNAKMLSGTQEVE
jgi:nucleoside-triphosphatase THEP1